MTQPIAVRSRAESRPWPAVAAAGSVITFCVTDFDQAGERAAGHAGAEVGGWLTNVWRKARGGYRQR